MTNEEKILELLQAQGKTLAALQADVATVKTVQQEQGKSLATVEKGVKQLKKDVNHLIEYYDKHFISLRSRIEKLEEHSRP
jgi:hypothetical protein